MNQQVERNIDQEISQAEKAIAMGEALARLEKNRDFKKVVAEGFLREFALENLYFRGMRGVASNEKLALENMRKLDAVGELKNYFRGIEAHAAASAQKLPELSAVRTEILMEDDADE